MNKFRENFLSFCWVFFLEDQCSYFDNPMPIRSLAIWKNCCSSDASFHIFRAFFLSLFSLKFNSACVIFKECCLDCSYAMLIQKLNLWGIGEEAGMYLFMLSERYLGLYSASKSRKVFTCLFSTIVFLKDGRLDCGSPLCTCKPVMSSFFDEKDVQFHSKYSDFQLER